MAMEIEERKTKESTLFYFPYGNHGIVIDYEYNLTFANMLVEKLNLKTKVRIVSDNKKIA